MKEIYKVEHIWEDDLTFKNYHLLAQRTSATTTKEEKLMNGLLGLIGELGEIADIYKKHKFQGHELDLERIGEELGDVLWYLPELAEGLGTDLETEAKKNIAKLMRRYPNGFEVERSVNRDE